MIMEMALEYLDLEIKGFIQVTGTSYLLNANSHTLLSYLF